MEPGKYLTETGEEIVIKHTYEGKLFLMVAFSFRGRDLYLPVFQFKNAFPNISSK